MNKLFFGLIIITVLLYSCNCEKGSGKTKLQEYELEPFEGIVVKDIGTLNIAYAASPSITIETDDNLLQFVEIKYKNNKIEISINKCITSFTKLNINLSIPSFNYIEVSGDVDVICKDTFRIEELEISASDAGKINLWMNVNELSTKISDASSVNLSGSAQKHNIEIEDAGILNAFKLITKTSYIEVSDAAHCMIFVNDKLDATVSDSGELIYKGNPQKVNSNTTEAGKIKTEN